VTKDTWIKIGTNALVIGLAACIPLGLFLAWWFDNPSWLVLCGTLLIFLS